MFASPVVFAAADIDLEVCSLAPGQLLQNPRAAFATLAARGAAIGKVAAAPPRSLMGSRPRMSAPGQGSRSDQTITLKGVWYVLQLMSALGQKRTSS